LSGVQLPGVEGEHNEPTSVADMQPQLGPRLMASCASAAVIGVAGEGDAGGASTSTSALNRAAPAADAHLVVSSSCAEPHADSYCESRCECKNKKHGEIYEELGATYGENWVRERNKIP
tara:strand:+ start:1273 stop:1629 length:357 start_codon:yes stop_codon:yes gene_type:complete